jgi:O-antigen/teichoic acid export membrane protein
VIDRRQYLKQFMIILGGNSAAQAANLLSYPFLARIYTPQAFGTFAMFVAASAIPGAIACGRFDLAVTTAPRWGRFGMLWLCIAIAAGVGLLSIIGATVYWNVSGMSAEPILSLLLGATVFLTGVCAAESMFLMRHDLYRIASVGVFTRTGAAVTIQIALGFILATPFSLIIGFVAGLVAQALMLTFIIRRDISPGPPRLRHMRAMFLRFRRQVTVDIPSTLISAFSLNLLTFLLAIMYDQRTVGLYSIGNRLAIVPLQLFNDALSQIFFQKASRAREDRGHFWEEMKFSLLTSTLLSVGVLIGILLFARPFITLYLGKQWAPAAEMLIILAPMLALRSLTMSVGTTVFVMRSVHWLFIHNIANVAVTLIAFGLAWLFQLSSLGFLAVAALLLALEYAVFGAFLIFKARRDRPIV